MEESLQISSGIRMAAISSLPCSLALLSASSIPCLPSTTDSPPRDTVAAFVPFLWEEKPGISKQNVHGADNVASSEISSKKPELLQLFVNDLDVLPLPMPPRLQKPSSLELIKTDGTVSPLSRSHEQKRSVADSLLKKWSPRIDRAEDDPFLRAIQACTARNGTQSKGQRKLSRSPLLQKLFENEDEVSARTKRNNRASHPGRPHSLSTEVKPTSGLNVRQGNPRQLLEERGHRSELGPWRYTDQRNLSTPRTKSGVMELQQRRLMLGSCLGCRNPQGYEPSAILARARAPASNNSSY